MHEHVQDVRTCIRQAKTFKVAKDFTKVFRLFTKMNMVVMGGS